MLVFHFAGLHTLGMCLDSQSNLPGRLLVLRAHVPSLGPCPVKQHMSKVFPNIVSDAARMQHTCSSKI